jgi:glucose-1-phosphate cytidylyltransferase
MKTVILCGGYGTRIRDVSDDLPKPMIPIGNFPILWHIMKYYSCYGHKEFVLCLGYKSLVIKDFFLNYSVRSNDITIVLGQENAINNKQRHDEDGWSITMAETGINSMTGTRVKHIKNYIGDDENFMLTYGDGVGDIDIEKLLAFHKAHGKIATLTGVIVNGFNEKPQTSEGRINGGFFVFKKEFFNYLNDSENLVLEEEPMRALVKDKQLMVFEHNGFWQPMDTYREYALLNNMYDKKQAPWVKW